MNLPEDEVEGEYRCPFDSMCYSAISVCLYNETRKGGKAHATANRTPGNAHNCVCHDSVGTTKLSNICIMFINTHR